MGKQTNRIVPKTIDIGDYILVHWIDIMADHSGDKKKSDIMPCITGGYFAGYKIAEHTNNKLLITLDTLHPFEKEDENYEGYDAYPMSVVKKVQILLKAKEVKWLMSRTA